MDRKHTMQRDGKTYVLYGGLLDLLHEQSAGRFSISTALAQIPHADNGNTAIVTAEVRIVDEHGQTVRACCGIGDANPGNCNRMMAVHLIRFAETRAKARAMRDIVNVGEALNDDPTDEDDAAPPVVPVPAQGAPPKVTREQLWARYRQLADEIVALAQSKRVAVPDAVAQDCHLPADLPNADLVATYKRLRAWHDGVNGNGRG
jgi:hypothetical protein